MYIYNVNFLKKTHQNVEISHVFNICQINIGNFIHDVTHIVICVCIVKFVTVQLWVHKLY